MTTETSLRTGAKYQSSGRKREFIAAQIAGSLAVVMLVMFPVAAWNAPPIVGETTRLSVASDGSEGNGSSALPAISADGRYVAFESLARNLVSDDTNNFADIFVHDRQTGETTRASVASDGAEANHASLAPGISADGRYVAFWSSASNLVPDDTNDTADIFVRDRHTGETTRVSVSSDGTEANGFSAFIPTISADGRYVAFQSSATNLVSGDTNNFADIFVHDRQTGETTRASVAGDGTEGNNSSDYPSISADGRYVAFHSSASNLVPDDTNDTADIFVHDRQTGETTRVSVASDGTEVSRPYNSYSPQSVPTDDTLHSIRRRSTSCQTTLMPRGITSSMTGRLARLQGYPCRVTGQKRVDTVAFCRRSVPTVDTFLLTRMRAPWSMVTPTISGTSSSMTGRRARPPGHP